VRGAPRARCRARLQVDSARGLRGAPPRKYEDWKKIPQPLVWCLPQRYRAVPRICARERLNVASGQPGVGVPLANRTIEEVMGWAGNSPCNVPRSFRAVAGTSTRTTQRLLEAAWRTTDSISPATRLASGHPVIAARSPPCPGLGQMASGALRTLQRVAWSAAESPGTGHFARMLPTAFIATPGSPGSHAVEDNRRPNRRASGNSSTQCTKEKEKGEARL
jgi:hypothetical protein